MSKQKKTVEQVSCRIDKNTQYYIGMYMGANKCSKTEALRVLLKLGLKQWVANQALEGEE